LKKNELIIAFVSGLISIIFTAIYDWTKEKPIFSTFIYIIKWIWKNLFEFELKIWQILLFLFAFILVRKVLIFFKNGSNNEDWLKYTEDSIDGIKWRWDWIMASNSKWNVENLTVVCDGCGTSTHLDFDPYNDGLYAECPRCNKKVSHLKDLDKVRSIIIDNIKRDLYRQREQSSISNN